MMQISQFFPFVECIFYGQWKDDVTLFHALSWIWNYLLQKFPAFYYRKNWTMLLATFIFIMELRNIGYLSNSLSLVGSNIGIKKDFKCLHAIYKKNYLKIHIFHQIIFKNKPNFKTARFFKALFIPILFHRVEVILIIFNIILKCIKRHINAQIT